VFLPFIGNDARQPLSPRCGFFKIGSGRSSSKTKADDKEATIQTAGGRRRRRRRRAK